jgi:hypothetical protein
MNNSYKQPEDTFSPDDFYHPSYDAEVALIERHGWVISPNEPSPLSSFHIEAKWMLMFFRVRTRKNIELAFMGAGNLIYYDSERHPNPQVLIERANLTSEPPQKLVQKPTKPRATKPPGSAKAYQRLPLPSLRRLTRYTTGSLTDNDLGRV